MAQYQRVYPRYWADMAGASEDAKLVGLYILTCRHRSTEGYYHLPVAYAAEDLELRVSATRKAMAELEAREFIAYDDEAKIVFIRKALTYPGQVPATDRQVTGAVRAVEHLMPSPLWDQFIEMAETHAPLLAERLANPSANGLANPLETH